MKRAPNIKKTPQLVDKKVMVILSNGLKNGDHSKSSLQLGLELTFKATSLWITRLRVRISAGEDLQVSYHPLPDEGHSENGPRKFLDSLPILQFVLWTLLSCTSSCEFTWISSSFESPLIALFSNILKTWEISSWLLSTQKHDWSIQPSFWEKTCLWLWCSRGVSLDYPC